MEHTHIHRERERERETRNIYGTVTANKICIINITKQNKNILTLSQKHTNLTNSHTHTNKQTNKN